MPPAYDGRIGLPLVVLLHGWTSSKEEIERVTRFGEIADREGFFLAIPDATEGFGANRGWNAGFLNLGRADADDTKLIGDLIDRCRATLAVDPKRIFLAGHSSGAMMAGTAAASLGDRIAAIGVVSGTIGFENDHLKRLESPVSAILIHGTADDVVPYDRRTRGFIDPVSAPDSAKWWARQDGCGAGAKTVSDGFTTELFSGGRGGAEVELVSIGEGGHAWPSSFGPDHLDGTELLWRFFKAHPKL